MSLRFRLIVAFFLLSVVPLAAVTFYAYASNARALRAAAEREADLLAGELGQRMQLVTTQLAERVEHVMDIAELQEQVERVSLQAEQRQAAAQAPKTAVVTTSFDEQFGHSLGEAAMLLNNVHLRGLRGLPRRPPAPAGASRAGVDAGAGESGGAGAGRSGPARPDRPGEATSSPSPPDAPPTAGPPPVPADALRIDLAPVRRELLREMVPDGRFDTLTPEQRQKLGDELRIRMLGIQEGLQLGARALQRRADEAQRQAAAAARSTALPASPAAPPAPPPVAAAPAETAPAPPVKLVRKSKMTGTHLDVSLERDGQVVSELNAEIHLPNLLATVFSTTRRDRGEVPFAFAADGQLFTPNPEDRTTVESFGDAVRATAPAVVRLRDWIIVTTSDPSGSGLSVGRRRSTPG
jgi:hypothetical protein